MKVSTLKSIIREIIEEESKKDVPLNSSDLSKLIDEYGINNEKLKKLEESIKSTLTQISEEEKSQKEKFKLIEKSLNHLQLTEQKATNWVASIKEKLKYKDAAKGISYKELWETALTKLNKATQNIMTELYNTNLEANKVATKKELEIGKIDEGILNKIKSLFLKFKSFIKSFQSYKSVVDSLPIIK